MCDYHQIFQLTHQLILTYASKFIPENDATDRFLRFRKYRLSKFSSFQLQHVRFENVWNGRSTNQQHQPKINE